MTRQASNGTSTTLKATFGIMAASAILLWQVLACTESPMAFAPDGKDLAFVTMEPYDDDDLHLVGARAYRLMVVSKRKDVRLIEQTTDAMLTAPAYSPDGSRLCYLRLALLTTEQWQEQVHWAKLRLRRWDQASSQPATTGPASRPAPAPATAESWRTESLSLPDIAKTRDFIQRATVNRPAAAELVIRRTGDYSVTRTIPIELRGLKWGKKKDGLPSFLLSYLTVRPQYGTDGKWIYVCVGDILLALNPDQKVQRILAAPASSPTLSPDGGTIAFLQEPAIGFMRTNGRKAVYVRLDGSPSLSGLAWVDNQTVAILSKLESAPAGGARSPATRPAGKVTITFMRSDGTILPRPRISLPTEKDDDKFGELAVSNDGSHVVVSFGQTVCFLDANGRIIKRLNAADGAGPRKGAEPRLVQPTFSPDSRSVAFKYMAKDPYMRAEAIVFFSPEGKELARALIAKIKHGTTRPAGTSKPKTPAPDIE